MPGEPLDPVAALLRSWWLVMLATVVCAVGLAAVFASRAPTYTSTTTLLFAAEDPAGELTGNGSRLTGVDYERELGTQRETVLADAAAGAAAGVLGADVDDVRDAVGVSVVDETNVLLVSGSGATPAEAQAVTGAVTDAYVTQDREFGAQRLLAQADALTASVDAITAELTALPPDPDPTRPDPRRAVYAGQLASVAEQQERLRTAASVYPGRVTVLTAPDLPEEPSSPGPLRGAVVGASLGLVLGLLAALARGAGPGGRRRVAPAGDVASQIVVPGTGPPVGYAPAPTFPGTRLP